MVIGKYGENDTSGGDHDDDDGYDDNKYDDYEDYYDYKDDGQLTPW